MMVLGRYLVFWYLDAWGDNHSCLIAQPLHSSLREHQAGLAKVDPAVEEPRIA